MSYWWMSPTIAPDVSGCLMNTVRASGLSDVDGCLNLLRMSMELPNTSTDVYVSYSSLGTVSGGLVVEYPRL